MRTTDTSSFFGVCLLAALIGFGLSKRNLSWIPVVVGMILLGLIAQKHIVKGLTVGAVKGGGRR